jgi:hypothetical protein
MDHLTPFFVISLLVLISLRNGIETNRGISCVAVLWCTVPGYLIYQSEYYFPIVDMLGSYGYQSATPLLAICALACIRDKLSTVLMCLFTVLIFANGYFFWLEGQNYQIQDAHQAFVWSVFFIEVTLMLSPRLTNGIHRAIQRFVRDRDPATDGGIVEHRSASNLVNMVKAPK